MSDILFQFDKNVEVVPKRGTPMIVNGKPRLVTDKKSRIAMKALAEEFHWYMVLGKRKMIQNHVILKINFNVWTTRKWKLKSNDIDNFFKGFTDPGSGIIYHDDSQIVKFYGDCNVFFSSPENRLQFTLVELSPEEKQERGILI